MAQFNVATNAADFRTGACEVRVTVSGDQSVTFVLRAGETVVSDDPVAIEHLRTLGVLTTRGTRPPAPTHDVDTKPRNPRPQSADDGATRRVR